MPFFFFSRILDHFSSVENTAGEHSVLEVGLLGLRRNCKDGSDRASPGGPLPLLGSGFPGEGMGGSGTPETVRVSVLPGWKVRGKARPSSSGAWAVRAHWVFPIPLPVG